MKVWLTSLLFLSSTLLPNNDYQMMVKHDDEVPVTAFKEGEKGHLDAYFIQPDYLAVRGMQVSGFDRTSLAKLNQAFEVLERVVNSEEFKERVINFKNTKGVRAFASSGGKSNEEIYQIFMEGRETLQPNTAGEMNFYLRLYNKSWSKVVGYTTPDSNVININWKFFKNYKPNDVAGNLAHEWTHKMGFGHKSAAEHDSVPYAIGYIVDEMAAKYLKTRELY